MHAQFELRPAEDGSYGQLNLLAGQEAPDFVRTFAFTIGNGELVVGEVARVLAKAADSQPDRRRRIASCYADFVFQTLYPDA